MPNDAFVNALGMRPAAPAAIMLLDEEQQRSLRGDTSAQVRRGSGGGLFVPTTPPMLAMPQAAPQAPQAPPPPTTSYLRTDFTTNRQRPPQHPSTTWKGRDPSGSSPRTNFTSNRATTYVDDSIGSGANPSGESFSPPTDYATIPPTATPFVPVSQREREVYSDPTEGFTGARSTLKLSVTYILIGAVAGLALGVLFSQMGVSDLAAQWISLPGDLFLRALKSLVVPYVFCSVAVAIGDIVFVGKVSIVGLQTLRIFAVEWVSSTLLGIGVAMLFRPLFRLDSVYSSTDANAVGFTCANGLMLELQSNNSLTCSANATSLTVDTAFVLDDVNDVFEKNDDSVLTDLTLSDQLLTTLDSVVPDNVFASLADADLLAIIAFAMVLGAIAGRSYFTKTRRVNYLYLVLLQLRNTFFLAMEWVIWATPVAVISIIAGAFASNQDAVSELSKSYTFLVACLAAMALQILVLYPCIIFLLTRCNPYAHMRHMLRAYLFAFGSASSLATAPVTLGCVQKARVCSQSLANFVVSIGVVTNMSGSGWYYPVGIVFLAESSGNGDQLTMLRLVAIFFLTLVACAGTPPVPSSGVVLMSTMYKTVFGVSSLPSTWALYVAMDFFADRLSTVCNVNDDIMALKVIAENTDETIVGDHLGQRE